MNVDNTTENKGTNTQQEADQRDQTVTEESENQKQVGNEVNKIKMYISSCVRKCIFFGCGGTFLIFGFILTGYWKSFYDDTLMMSLKNVLKINQDSQTYKLWVNTTMPVYTKIYLFNWTNPEESLAQKEKPNFIEKGPYVFLERRLERDIVWNNNATFTYKPFSEWHFVQEMSKGSLSDNITNINVIAVAVGSLSKYIPTWQKVIVSATLKVYEKNLYVTKSVGEWLFDGYDDKLITFASKIKKYIKFDLPFDKFGFWYKKNGTIQGTYNLYTGEHDLNKIGEIHSWDYKTQTDAFDGACGQVHGSSGDFWGINPMEKSTFSLYAPDLCSTIELTKGNVVSIGGVGGITLVGKENVFDNGSRYEEAKCYCDGECRIASGVRNMSKCAGVPIYTSFPHFYLADPIYTNSIDGLHPDPSQHSFQLVLQQFTATPMEAHARIQINVLLEPIEGISMMSSVKETYIPCFWFEETFRLSDDILWNLYLVLNLIPNALIIGGVTFVIIGAILLITGFVLSRLGYLQPAYTETLE